jgi:hypothetical protein
VQQRVGCDADERDALWQGRRLEVSDALAVNDEGLVSALFTIPADTVIVTPELATLVQAMLADGRRKFRDDGVLTRYPQLRDWCEAIDAAAARHPGTPAPVHGAQVCEYVSTARAAELIGCSPRNVRYLPMPSRKRGNRLEWLESAVRDQAQRVPREGAGRRGKSAGRAS